MTNLVIFFLLFTAIALGDVNYEITINDIPNSSSGTVIGVPRQQTVCLSAPGELVTMWTGRYFYKTTDRGTTWSDSLESNLYSDIHNHLCVWEDTIYNFSPFNNHSDTFQVQIIETTNLTEVDLIYIDTIGYSDGNDIIPSGQPTGNEDEMILIIRDGHTEMGHYFLSSDRGRTWINQFDEIDNYGGINNRMGLIRVGDSCMAALYTGVGNDLDLWHWNTSSYSWTEEANGSFIDNFLSKRIFSATVARDTVWAMLVDDDASTYIVHERQAGFGNITRDTLWTGNPSNGGNYLGYCALQKIGILNTPVAFYTHTDDGSAGPARLKLYMRLYFDGQWQPEQQISHGTGYINLTCPFIVPISHGPYAYCQFKDDDGGHLAVIRIDTGVTRGDIDRAILDFRQGLITEQEVLDLIEQYNSQQ